MKAVQCKYLGDIDEVMSVENSVEIHIPKLSDEYIVTEKIHPLVKMATKEDRKTHMIIQTLAVALSPVDCRILTGKTREMQGPPSFPYIPGGDCCGVVTEVQPNETYFKPGDIVMARFTNVARDALAEYARVSTSCCEKIDPNKGLSPVHAAALASASPAVALAEYIRPGERVLVLGAGGGIGSHFCQLARLQGASFVCGVSKNPQRLLDPPIQCHKAVDYTQEHVFENREFQEERFDIIVDLACGGWLKLKDMASKGVPSIVKTANQGGRFLTVTTDTPTFEARGLWTILALFVVKPFLRSAWSRIATRGSLPTFTCANDCLPNNREIITKTRDLAYEEKLMAVIDGNSPYSMTTEGVRKAFRALESRHANGKVVVEVARL